MPWFDTRDGRKEFKYSTLTEYKQALTDRILKIVPTKKHELFGEVVTEIDVSSLHEKNCVFGSEYETLNVLIMMLESYENSDSDHSIFDFYNQNHVQHLVLGSRARNDLVHCHAMQTTFRNYKASNGSKEELLSLMAQMKQRLQRSLAYNNTSVAAHLSNEVLLGGEEFLKKLSSFTDNFMRDIRDTDAELDEMLKELELE